MDKVSEAIMFATEAHAATGQMRKGVPVPYIVHPVEAAAIVARMTQDMDVIAAAALHDVVEDTPCTVEDVQSRFGARVAQLVAAESEDKREDQPAADTWRERKQEAIDHIRVCDDRDVKIVMLADKLSNMRSLRRDWLESGPAVWDRFNEKDPKNQRWYYESLCDALECLADTPEWREYRALIDEVFAE